jgi:hypothetical protein
LTNNVLEEVSSDSSTPETPYIEGSKYAISVTNEVINEVRLNTCPHCKRLLERALAKLELKEE